MSELTEDFLKMLQIALVVIGILSIFFIFIQYNIILEYHYAQKEAIMLGDAVIGSDCLTVIENGEVIKGLFSENKLTLQQGEAIKTCINYPNGYVTIETLNEPYFWQFYIGQDLSNAQSEFFVAIQLEDESVIPAKMVVSV